MDCFVLKKPFKALTCKKTDKELMLKLLGGYTCGSDWDLQLENGDFSFTIGNYTKTDIGDFEYVVNITKDGVYVGGKDLSALMHGIIEMLEKIRCEDEETFLLECEKWSQKPAIGFRSVHLCVFPETKLDFLKKSVRACGMARYTHIVLEFWGMLKLDCMKELAWPFAYTKEQIREIVREARGFGMEVIPMFNHWGHAAACRASHGKHVVLDQNPKYEYMFNAHGWVWKWENERVYELLRKVRAELIELCGEGSYFHLGCDEAYDMGHGENKGLEICNYINRLQGELDKIGRRAIIWGDMLISQEYFKTEKQHYSAHSTPEIAETILKNLSKKVIIADWQYDITDGVWKSSKIFSDNGFEVLCCPWDNYSNIQTAVETAIKGGYAGIMHTTWHTMYKGFPQMMYAGDYSYKQDGKGLNTICLADIEENRFKTAEILRKVYPSGGIYDGAGWSEKSVGPGL